MRAFSVAIFSLILLVGCVPDAQQPPEGVFISQEYGFSFSHPTGWREVTQDLPNKWAIVDENSDAILFTVNNAQVNNLALLGTFQAIRDVYQVENYTGLSQEKMDVISKIVKMQTFGSQEFYTYAIDFRDKGIQSIVSGTLCGTKEITLVLVSKEDTAALKMQLYTDLLNSFKCTV
jgi:hypothetical protein